MHRRPARIAPGADSRVLADADVDVLSRSGSSQALGAQALKAFVLGEAGRTVAAEAVARDSAGKLFVYRGNGDGGWASGGTQIGQGWGGMTAILPVGDFDGDRNPDIVARRPDGILMLYPG